MSAVQQIEKHMALVVWGAFNPTIFQPSWFAQEDLICDEEVKAANIEIIHQEVAVFNLRWVKLEVTRDRLILQSSSESHYEAVRDLLIGTFDLLRHIPTRALGVNHALLIECGSRDIFNQLGWNLVPEDRWSPVLQTPGMVRVEEQGERTDGYDGYLRVKVEPILDGGTKVLIEVNDHFSFSQDNEPNSTVAIGKILDAEWKNISERANPVFEHVQGIVK
ncbi:MAG: hypothetical protein OXF21_06740 [bacterium]|nr:hypothetical protein [bacterium]